MAKKNAKQTTKSTPKKAPQKKPAPAKKSGGSSLLAETRDEAIAHENAGRWADAADTWERVERIAGSKAERKEAAGRAAAAKVRASANRPVEDGAGTAAEDATTERDARVDDAADDDGANDAHEEEGAGDGERGEGGAAGAEDAAGAATGEDGPSDGAAGTANGKRKAAQPKEPPAPRERDPRLPEPGTVIIKKDRHGAERARCTVTETGIEYAGKTYKSISAAALVAAKDLGLGSKTQDGYAFWGLKKAEARTAAKKDPVESLQKAWDRYRERADALVKAATDESRPKLFDAINQHAAALTQLTGGAA